MLKFLGKGFLASAQHEGFLHIAREETMDESEVEISFNPC
jgi:hypothetical protein